MPMLLATPSPRTICPNLALPPRDQRYIQRVPPPSRFSARTITPLRSGSLARPAYTGCTCHKKRRYSAKARWRGSRPTPQGNPPLPTKGRNPPHPTPQLHPWMIGSTSSAHTPTRILGSLPPATGTHHVRHARISPASHPSDSRLSNNSHMEVGKALLKYKSASTVFSNSFVWIPLYL